MWRTVVGIMTMVGVAFTGLLVALYPVVIINWVQYLGPPGPFSFPDSLDLLEVLGGLSWQRESPWGGSPRVREDPLGTPPLSLCQESL